MQKFKLVELRGPSGKTCKIAEHEALEYLKRDGWSLAEAGAVEEDSKVEEGTEALPVSKMTHRQLNAYVNEKNLDVDLAAFAGLTVAEKRKAIASAEA